MNTISNNPVFLHIFTTQFAALFITSLVVTDMRDLILDICNVGPLMYVQLQPQPPPTFICVRTTIISVPTLLVIRSSVGGVCAP